VKEGVKLVDYLGSLIFCIGVAFVSILPIVGIIGIITKKKYPIVKTVNIFIGIVLIVIGIEVVSLYGETARKERAKNPNLQQSALILNKFKSIVSGFKSKSSASSSKTNKSSSKISTSKQTASSKSVALKVIYAEGATTVWQTPAFKTVQGYVVKGQSVPIIGQKTVNGMIWYQIGTNEWIPEIYLQVGGATPAATSTANTQTQQTSSKAYVPPTQHNAGGHTCPIYSIDYNRKDQQDYVYHVPGQHDQKSTSFICWDSEAQAQAAGYRKSDK
jgi:hypothetical protein